MDFEEDIDYDENVTGKRFFSKHWFKFMVGFFIIGLITWASIVQFVALPRRKAEIPYNEPIAENNDSLLAHIF